MDAGKAIEALEDKILQAIYESHLHPAICRLVMLNINHVLLDKEREMSAAANEKADAAAPKDGGADG